MFISSFFLKGNKREINREHTDLFIFASEDPVGKGTLWTVDDQEKKQTNKHRGEK